EISGNQQAFGPVEQARRHPVMLRDGKPFERSRRRMADMSARLPNEIGQCQFLMARIVRNLARGALLRSDPPGSGTQWLALDLFIANRQRLAAKDPAAVGALGNEIGEIEPRLDLGLACIALLRLAADLL